MTAKPATYTPLRTRLTSGPTLYVKGGAKERDKADRVIAQLIRDGEPARQLRVANQPYSDKDWPRWYRQLQREHEAAQRRRLEGRL